jgi:hypothetical protein
VTHIYAAVDCGDVVNPDAATAQVEGGFIFGLSAAMRGGCIPDGSLVLGFQHYWLGLRRFPDRTWLLPFNMANPDYEAEPVSLDVALDLIDPDIILIDRHARALFAETSDPAHRYHYLSVGFDAFRARRPLRGRCVVGDRSYGTMEVYEVASPARELVSH